MLWLARNKDGTLKLTPRKPYRKEKLGEWFIGREFEGDFLYIDKKYYPDLKWEDDPIPVEIVRKI